MKMVSRMWARVARWLVACMGLGLVAACSTTSDFPPAPSVAATQDYTYIVGPLDNLNIIVWRNPELSMSVPVRPDGKFSTPLIDELVAQGKNSVQIARDIEKNLEKYVRDPVVTVIVTGFVGPFDQQIRVVGEAAKPQALPFRQGRADRFRRRQRGDHPAHRRRRQAVLGALARPHPSRRHLGQRADEAGRHPDHSAEFLLSWRTAARRPSI